MIATKCFTREWLDECRGHAGRIDPGLLEKSIYAFELLGRLASEGLPFVFKGGTALLLLLDNFRRLSIDVDIACAASRDEVARVLGEVMRNSVFSSIEPDERDPARLPKRHHYALGFRSVVSPQYPATLQLDVLEDAPHYPHTQQLPLRSRFVLPAGDVFITVPTIEGLLADKLTAFAPTTIGVPYGAYKASIKIAKQMADVGELFGHARDGAGLVEAYQRAFAAENRYRGGAFTMAQALDDTIQAAFLLNCIWRKGFVAGTESDILKLGVTQVDSHMIGRRYAWDDARIAAARAAHLAALIRNGKVPEDLSEIRYDESAIEMLKSAELDGEFRILNGLKRTNPEAFYHWVKVLQAIR
jgi:hypothetical protein